MSISNLVPVNLIIVLLMAVVLMVPTRIYICTFHASTQHQPHASCLTSFSFHMGANKDDTVRTRLKQFSLMDKIKKKDFQVIVEHLTIEEVEVIKDMLALMDTDNDDNVTYQELKAGLRKVGSRNQR